MTQLPTTCEVRVLRALAFGGVATGLADGAHRLAGHDPSPAVSLAGCLTAAWLVWPRTSGSLSARRLVLTTVVLQWVLHAAFVLTGAQSHVHAAGTGHVGHLGAAAHLGFAGTDGVGAAAATGSRAGQWSEVPGALAEVIPGGSDLRMLAAHMTAAAVLALWMAVGERLVFRAARLGLGRAVVAAAALVERARTAALVLPAVVAQAPDARWANARQRHAAWRRRERFRDVFVEHTVKRRGPPPWSTVTSARPRRSPAPLWQVAGA